MKPHRQFRVFASIISLLAGAPWAEAQAPAIIPLPQTTEVHPGHFMLHAGDKILASAGAEETAHYLSAELRRRASVNLDVISQPGPAEVNRIQLLLGDPNPAPEGYTLTVSPGAVIIKARTPAGLFYGAQSLLQLLPTGAADEAIPCVQVEDQPRFRWRGLMLDVSRHFFSKDEVERLLDEMAWHKLNMFHWHLVDDQGWRIEIKKYPRLTGEGAWRKAIGFGLDPKAGTAYGADGRYGGYYTQDDIREVVAYAQARHITVVPEIEMPGHSSAALMAYPQFSCTGGPFTTDLPGGVFNGVYCAGNEDTFAFIDDILTEVSALFPGPYIHIGGDEVPVDNWKKCPKCQARLHREGLARESELEGYFIRRVEKLVHAHGKRLVGWSEIREGGLADEATVMDWVGGATEAATAGHDVVMSPLADCYFDHYQSLDHSTEPRAIGGYLPLRQVYQFEPMPTNLPARYQEHILGAQANVWTEYMPSFKHVQYMVFPRLCALAEVDWSPKDSRQWADFCRRVRADCARLDTLGVNHRSLSDLDEKAPAGRP
ncbi:MAG TPA: beta-N-acetylhexosaminidase [Verrucomicrobiae bacterium]|jgi:hexosaminidase